MKSIWIPLLALMVAVRAEAASDDPATTVRSRCEALRVADMTHDPAVPIRISAPFTRFVDAAGDVPAYCQVSGYIAPNVGFEIRLPASGWNGKLLEIGCGGDCGFIQAGACRGPLQRGYACIATDTGHRGQGGLWALDDIQAQIDFAYRAVHVVALAGKRIVEQHYGSPPKHSYFFGCSTGGRQGLIEAQRFPHDFDGIIAGAPWIADSDSAMNALWAARSLRGDDGKPLLTPAEMRAVHDAVVAACDSDDGVKDGIIGDPRRCTFDPASLLCAEQREAPCISARQADAIRRVYDGPADSRGKRLYPSGAARGSERNWIDDGSGSGYIRADGSPGESEEWATSFFRFMVIPPSGASWKPADFDFDRDPVRFASSTQEPLLNATNPDLRRFRNAGGKLIVYQGWNDESTIPAMTIDYYETVEKTMGGRAATQSFFRLFMVPGMNHCGAGDGAFAVDYLSALEAWVERGLAPDVLAGAHPKTLEDTDTTTYAPILRRFPLAPADVLFSRPIYPYPPAGK
jgi:hypothetical protein